MFNAELFGEVFLACKISGLSENLSSVSHCVPRVPQGSWVGYVSDRSGSKNIKFYDSLFLKYLKKSQSLTGFRGEFVELFW